MLKDFLRLGLVFLLAVGPAGAVDLNFRPEIPTGPQVRPVEPLKTAELPNFATPLITPQISELSLKTPSVQEIQPEISAPSPIAPNLQPETSRRDAEFKLPDDPAAQQTRLDLTFDKRAPLKASFFDPLPVHGVVEATGLNLRREVSRLAQPWRTETQLEKLKAAPRKEGESFKFTVIGDAEPGRFALWRVLFNEPGVFARLLKDSFRHATDFTVQLGDMVSRGTLRNFLEFFRGLTQIGSPNPYITVIGNHDRRKPHGVSDDRAYRSLFGKTDYFFDHAGVRFVTLDSSAGRVSDDQLRWLERALDTPNRKIVFTHIPPAVIKPWGKDGGDKSWGGFREGSERFTQIVSRAGVERVYMGHIHGLRFKDFAGVKYVISGGGGSPLYPGGVHNNFHHYLTVEVTPDGIRETVHRTDGTSYSVP